MTTINFKNKTVVITGGSRGIGLEITKTFLKHQANVIILARNKPKRKIQSKGNASYFIECDIRDVDSIDSAVKLIASKYKSIDVLINKARTFPQFKNEDMTRIFSTPHLHSRAYLVSPSWHMFLKIS